MQATRERILHILKERGQATVDDLSRELGLTTVTVRHHLDILRGDGLVSAPYTQRCKAPGRPKHVYTLAEESSHVFPKRYAHLAHQIIAEMRLHFSPGGMAQIMQRIGERIAAQAELPNGGNFEARFTTAVQFLDELGYMTHWEKQSGGKYLLHIANCPYEKVSQRDHEVCLMDETLLTILMGETLQRISWSAAGDRQCTYAIHPPAQADGDAPA
jgi:predicted ArsR family transcriptional regulator